MEHIDLGHLMQYVTWRMRRITIFDLLDMDNDIHCWMMHK